VSIQTVPLRGLEGCTSTNKVKNKIIPYHPKLKLLARELRKNSTLAEIILWKAIKQRALGVQFHRQVPILNFIVDFYCHELKLVIEIDGNSHEQLYTEDLERQKAIEKYRVEFIRFSDAEIKKDIFSVSLALDEKVKQLSKHP